MHVQWLFLMLGVGGIAMFCGGCRRKGGRPTALSLVAVAAIVGGFLMFAHKSDERHDVVSAEPFEAADFGERIRHEITREVHEGLRELDEIGHGQFGPEFPFADGAPGGRSSHATPAFGRVGMIALGSVLLICGWLLFNRDRSRPFAMKAVTVLGIAATGAILFSIARWDAKPRRHFADQDTVVRVSADEDEIRPPRSDRPEAPPRSHHPIRRAKRPVSRADRQQHDTIDQLPPRAGEIPVHAELAQSAGDSPAAPSDEAAPADAAKPAADQDDNDEDSDKQGQGDDNERDRADESGPAAPEIDEPKIEVPVAVDSHAAESAAVEPTAPATHGSEGLPEWANKPAKLVNSVYRVSIQSGLYTDVPECQRALDDQIKKTVDDYIDRWMGPGTAALVAADRDYLNTRVKKQEYSEVVNTASVGPMHQIHALLEFDDATRAEFHERWRRAVVTERVWVVGFGSAVVLALLSTAFGYLKLDQQTSGRQSGRLGVAATLVALIVAAGALLARWAVPF